MTIAEVCKLHGLTQDTLRYYERIGLLPPVTRNQSGNRDYQENDLKWVELIKCLRASGISIEVLIEYVALFQQGEGTAAARKDLLIQQRDQLAVRIAEMQKTIERLDLKIERYEQRLMQKENDIIRANRVGDGEYDI